MCPDVTSNGVDRPEFSGEFIAIRQPLPGGWPQCSRHPPREIPEDVRLEFANLVGIMALLPFMREAVADMTRKVVGHPVIMPMIKTGDIRFEGDAGS